MSKKIYNCIVSGKPIPEERVEALKMLGVPENQWTCVENSFAKPKQGIFMGEVGGSEMKVVDKVYNDSVRAVFKHADKESEEEFQEDETAQEKTKFYSDREMNYYIQDDEDNTEENMPIVKKLDS